MEKEFKSRLITGLLFGLSIILLILGGKYSSSLLFGLIGFLTASEYLQISGTRVKDAKFFRSLVILLLLYTAAAFTSPQDTLFLATILISLFVYLVLFWSMLVDRPLPHHRINSSFVIFYPGLSVFPAISHLQHTESHPTSLLLGFFAILWMSDSGAYFVGRKIGRHKVLPRVSPGKSWEGVIGAGITSVLVSVVISFITQEYSLMFWITLALVIWVSGSAGDFTESAIKRQYSIKDSGRLLPGHGGFLDRFDSLIFALPTVYLLLLIFNFLL